MTRGQRPHRHRTRRRVDAHVPTPVRDPAAGPGRAGRRSEHHRRLARCGERPRLRRTAGRRHRGPHHRLDVRHRDHRGRRQLPLHRHLPRRGAGHLLLRRQHRRAQGPHLRQPGRPRCTRRSTSRSPTPTTSTRTTSPTSIPTTRPSAPRSIASSSAASPSPAAASRATLGAAAGSQGDGVGVAFSGSTSLENQYFVDGVNTTGLTLRHRRARRSSTTSSRRSRSSPAATTPSTVARPAASSTSSPSQRLERVQGLGLRHCQPGVPGRRSASARRPRARRSTPPPTSPIDADFGFELGGPIIKDKLWFYVGVAPHATRPPPSPAPPSGRPTAAAPAVGRAVECDARAVIARRLRRRHPGRRSRHRLLPSSRTLDRRDLTPPTPAVYSCSARSTTPPPEHQGQLTLHRRARHGRAAPASTACPARRRRRTRASPPTSPRSGRRSSTTTRPRSRPSLGWHRETLKRHARPPSHAGTEPLQVLLRRQPRHLGPPRRRGRRDPGRLHRRRRRRPLRASSRTAR